MLAHIVHQPPSIQLGDAVPDQRFVSRKPDLTGQGLSEIVEGSCAVGQLEHRGRRAVEAVGLLAGEIEGLQIARIFKYAGIRS